MIALCSKHTPRADGNKWTADELRVMKLNPFLTGKDARGDFAYLRKQFTCRA
jgi:hypothetical protein